MDKKTQRELSPGETEALIGSAHTMLDDHSWIKQSFMLERVYFLGVFAGLRDIAREEDLKGMLIRLWADTAFNRAWDNTFASTEMGRAFVALDHSLHDLASEAAPEGIRADSATEALDTLERTAASHERQIEVAGRHIQELIALIRDGVERCTALPTGSGAHRELIGEQFAALRALEYWVRIVSLLETDHDRWKGLVP